MKTNKSIIALMLVSVFALTSCKDYLTAKDLTTGGMTADEYFQKNPDQLLPYAYSLLKPIVARFDVYVQGTDLYTTAHQKPASKFTMYNYTAEEDGIKKLYSQCYACINAANAAIKYNGLESANGAEALFVRSYAYYVLTQQFGAVPYSTSFINDANRSYPRVPLTDIYAGLIKDLTSLTTSANLDQEKHDGHASQRAAYALLAKVYLAAGWDLDTKYTDVAAGTYTVQNTEYFQKAASAAKSAIDAGAVKDLKSLSFEQKWHPAFEGVLNGEEIFSVQYELAGYPGAADKGGHGLQNHYGTYFDNPTKTGGKYCDSEDAMSLKALQMWEEGDERFEATFMTTMYGYDGEHYPTTGYFAYYHLTEKEQEDLPVWKKYFPYTATEAEVVAWMAANQTRLTDEQVGAPMVYLLGDKVSKWEFNADGSVAKKTVSTVDYEEAVFNELDYAPVVKKWDDPNSIQSANLTTNCYRDIVLLHLSDLYLVVAEAELMAGNPETSLTYLNKVRERAGLDDITFESFDPEYNLTDVQPIDLILDERAKELFAEGHRWMDLRRTKQLVRYNVLYNRYVATADGMKGTDGKFKLYRPIPQAEISANTAITAADQNEGF